MSVFFGVRMSKICDSCNIEKDSSFFYIKDKKINRLDSSCKECRKLIVKKYALNNQDKIKISQKNYFIENKKDILAKNKENRIIKKLQYSESKKVWKENNREKVRGYRRKMKAKRKTSDLLYKLKENLRCRYSICLKVKKFNKTAKFREYLGCDLDFFKNHISSQFKTNMNWDNYGKYGWHIDHIKPLDSAKTEEELVKLLHYTNLQPLWAEDNYKKKNKCLN